MRRKQIHVYEISCTVLLCAVLCASKIISLDKSKSSKIVVLVIKLVFTWRIVVRNLHRLHSKYMWLFSFYSVRSNSPHLLYLYIVFFEQKICIKITWCDKISLQKVAQLNGKQIISPRKLGIGLRKISLQKVAQPNGEQIIFLQKLGIGFGNLVATAENRPPCREKVNLHATSEVIAKAAARCCSRVVDRCCCMCCIQACSWMNDKCAIALAQLCTALACLECLNCCCEVCFSCDCFWKGNIKNSPNVYIGVLVGTVVSQPVAVRCIIVLCSLVAVGKCWFVQLHYFFQQLAATQFNVLVACVPGVQLTNLFELEREFKVMSRPPSFIWREEAKLINSTCKGTQKQRIFDVHSWMGSDFKTK